MFFCSILEILLIKLRYAHISPGNNVSCRQSESDKKKQTDQADKQGRQSESGQIRRIKPGRQSESGQIDRLSKADKRDRKSAANKMWQKKRDMQSKAGKISAVEKSRDILKTFKNILKTFK